MATPEYKIDKLTKFKRWASRRYYLLIATAVLVVAIAWVLWPTPAGQSATHKDARIRGPTFDFQSRRDMLAVPPLQYTGIENIYIMKYGQYDPLMPLDNQYDNQDAVISQSGQTVDVTSSSLFEIVAAVRVKAPDNIAYVRVDNMQVVMGVSGAFIIPTDPPADEYEHVFESEGYNSSSGYMRVNVVWDNNGEGYALQHGEDLDIDNISLLLFQIG